MSPRPRVLFVCVENACRSQMAEALARGLLGDHAEIFSAGSRPGEQVNPLAIAVLREEGLSISGAAPKGIEDLPSGTFDYVVTMGCGDSCPQIAARRRIDWFIPDPKGQPIDVFRRTRDQIGAHVRMLADQIKHIHALEGA